MQHFRLAITLASALLAGPALAQQSDDPPLIDVDTTLRLDPVVVTARQWEELIQDVPQSISVLGADTIRDAGITSIREASFLVPNLHVTEFSSRRLSFPTFRGISTGVGDPSVTTYIDGVPQLKISSTNLAMLDVARLEFLRGPQGTLYGRNSIGGLIKVETTRPTNDPVLRLSTTWGNYDLQEHSVSYSGPIVEDEWYISLSGLYSERDGYTENTVTGNDLDSRRSTFGRGKVMFTPDDRNTFEYTIYSERSQDGGFVLGSMAQLESKSHHISIDFEGDADRDILSNSLTWTHEGDELDFISVSSYVDWDIDESSDFDFSPLDGVRRFTKESQEYFYQEFRVASPADDSIELSDDAELKWLVGGSLFASDSDASAANEFRPGGVGIIFPPPPGTNTEAGDFDDLGLAAFGQATITLNDKLDLTAGLRYDYEDKDADIRTSFVSGGFVLASSRTRDDESFDEWVPNFSAAYRFTEDLMAYARAARGFKAGGFNLSAPAGQQSFDTETSWTYEVGVKSSWFDDRVRFNAAYFYIDWDDLQLSLFDALSGGYIDNAGGGASQGFELEVAAKVAEGVDVFAGFGYTDATFDRFVDQFGVDDSGNDLAFVPETTFNAGAQFTGDLGGGVAWFARGEYVNIGSYHLDAGNRESESFGLANFRLGVEYKNLRVEGWMRNAFDDEYILVAFQPSPIDPTTFVGENGAPQTFGVTVSLEF